MSGYSSPALAYMQALRAERNEPTYASWFDVAAAYDAGIKHALEARASAKRAAKGLEQPINGPCRTTEVER